MEAADNRHLYAIKPLLTEDNIKTPMKLIFNSPVTANIIGEVLIGRL